MPKQPIPDESEEKRAYFRIDTVLPLTFRLENEAAQPLPRPTQVNLSMGGLALATERNLIIGDTLSLAFFLPSGPPIQTQAKVVRLFTNPNKIPARQVGIQFITIDERDQERLYTYIFKLQIAQRRHRHAT